MLLLFNPIVLEISEQSGKCGDNSTEFKVLEINGLHSEIKFSIEELEFGIDIIRLKYVISPLQYSFRNLSKATEICSDEGEISSPLLKVLETLIFRKENN
jgi:hypothetical protein